MGREARLEPPQLLLASPRLLERIVSLLKLTVPPPALLGQSLHLMQAVRSPGPIQSFTSNPPCGEATPQSATTLLALDSYPFIVSLHSFIQQLYPDTTLVFVGLC